jgi:hypothetical protein
MIGRRNYIEELTERVIAGKKAGQSVPDLQRLVMRSSSLLLAVGRWSPSPLAS